MRRISYRVYKIRRNRRKNGRNIYSAISRREKHFDEEIQSESTKNKS